MISNRYSFAVSDYSIFEYKINSLHNLAMKLMDRLILMISCYFVELFLPRKKNVSWYVYLYAAEHKWKSWLNWFLLSKKKRENNILAVSTLLYLYCLWFFMAFTGFSELWIRQLLIHLQIFTQMTTASSPCVQIPLSSGKMWSLHHKPEACGKFWGHFCHSYRRILYQPSHVFPCQTANLRKSRLLCDAVCDVR